MTTLTILQGFLTPVIAAVVAYIAWQQWQVNERKYRLELYERRLRVYQEVVAFLRRVLRDFKPEIAELQAFAISIAEADFLFDPDIPAYTNEIYKRAVTLRSAHNQYRDMFQSVPPGYDHQRVVDGMHEQEMWFTDQLSTGVTKQKFKKYLDVRR